MTSKAISRLLWPAFLAGIVLASISAAPFRYDYSNSGRYLMVVAQRMDPTLYPNDPVVASIARFDSLFYRLLPMVFHDPERLEGDLFVVYVGMKIALILSMFWFIRTLTKAPLAAVLLLAWCTQPSEAALGGVSLISNWVTHTEIALVLGILAVGCAVQRRYWFFWPLISLSLFIHSLVTIHLLACLLPILLFVERRTWPALLLGLAGFFLCFLGYIHWMTPPAMSSEEAKIFMSAKGQMVHVSPLAQGMANYVKTALLFGLAMLGQRRWLADQPAAKLILGFAVCGSLVAFLLSFASVIGGVSSFAQMQPMRIFFWVTLFLQVIVAWATCAAIKERHGAVWALLGYIVFGMAGALWAEGLAA